LTKERPHEQIICFLIARFVPISHPMMRWCSCLIRYNYMEI
jgi:hypothetical protein